MRVVNLELFRSYGAEQQGTPPCGRKKYCVNGVQLFTISLPRLCLSLPLGMLGSPWCTSRQICLLPGNQGAPTAHVAASKLNEVTWRHFCFFVVPHMTEHRFPLFQYW